MNHQSAVFHHEGIIADTHKLVQSVLAPKVLQIDEGYYPMAEMAKLGKAGAFLGHLSDYGSRFDTAILATAQIGQVCGTTAFLAWCHQVCGLYLDQSDNTALKPLLASHAIADSFGGTALSNPMKTWANIEKMLLLAQKDTSKATSKDSYLVSGTLPWISHIGAGQYCGAVASIEGGDEVFFLLRFDEKRAGAWRLEACPKFLGMEGSSTWRIVLQDYPISGEDIIALPSRDFIRRIRGAFVLLQVGMGAGIIQGAIDDMTAVAISHGHVNAYLEDQAGNVGVQLQRLMDKTLMLAKTPFETHKDFFLDVLSTRATAASLSLQATQAALLHQGAKGYAMTAAPQRRLREAQFVAIVTPAIKHLRYLSQQLMKTPLPSDDYVI